MSPFFKEKGAFFWVGIVIQLVQAAFLVLLGINAYFIQNELAQIRNDRAQIQILREFMAETKGNRFTAADGLAVWKEISSIKQEIATIPKEAPPKWFKDMVDDLQDSVDNLESKVVQNGAEIQAMRRDIDDLKRKSSP